MANLELKNTREVSQKSKGLTSESIVKPLKSVKPVELKFVNRVNPEFEEKNVLPSEIDENVKPVKSEKTSNLSNSTECQTKKQNFARFDKVEQKTDVKLVESELVVKPENVKLPNELCQTEQVVKPREEILKEFSQIVPVKTNELTPKSVVKTVDDVTPVAPKKQDGRVTPSNVKPAENVEPGNGKCQGYGADPLTKLHLCNSCEYHRGRNQFKP